MLEEYLLSLREPRQNRRLLGNKPASSGPAPPTPPTTNGLKSWVRSDVGITLNSGNVSAWADQSGNSNNWVQSTAANQPGYSSSGGAGGNAYLSFASPQFLVPQVGATFSILTFLIVMLMPSGSSNNLIGGPCTIDTLQGPGNLEYNDGSTTNAVLNFTAGNWAVVGAVTNGATDTLWNNNSTSNTNSGDGANGPNSFVAASLVLGAANFTGANDWASRIAEVALFNIQLGSSDRATWETYFHTRYGT